MVGERLGWLGIAIDPVANQAANQAANQRNAARISPAQSRVEVRVIATGEEAMIARHVLDSLGRQDCG